MAHELMTNSITGSVEMAYLLSAGIPWHGLGTAISDDNANDLSVWGEASNMTNWKIELAPILFYDALLEDIASFPSQSVAFRSDTRQALEVVGSNYQIVQPKQVLEFFQSIISDLGYTMTSAGVLFGGKKFWAQATNGQYVNIGGVDRVNNNILLATGFDGATVGMNTTVRVVCNNTLRMANANNSGKVKISHSTSFDSDGMKSKLGYATEQFEEWSQTVEKMTKVRLSERDAIKYFASVLSKSASKKAEEEATVGELLQADIMDDLLNGRFTASTTDLEVEKLLADADGRTVQKVYELYKGNGKGSDLSTAADTLWGAVNAVTEYVDHGRNTRTWDARFNQANFGQWANVKDSAWDNAVIML